MNIGTEEELQICIRKSFYDGSLPFFYNETDFKEFKNITDNWRVVLDELVEYERAKGILKGINTYSPPDQPDDNPWSNMYLENFMWQSHSNKKHFPKTYALLKQLPGLTFVGFASLAAGGKLSPHYGDTNAIIRCHLGLVIPAAYPVCGIRVGAEEKGWQEGHITCFTEAHLHHVWNNSDKKRYIMSFDIVHPKWQKQKTWICAKVLGAQTWVFLEERIPFLKKVPDAWLPVFHMVLSLIWRLYLPVQRSFGVFYN